MNASAWLGAGEARAGGVRPSTPAARQHLGALLPVGQRLPHDDLGVAPIPRGPARSLAALTAKALEDQVVRQCDVANGADLAFEPACAYPQCVAGFETLLDALGSGGRDFERVCRWYLENAPEYRGIVKRVWLWQEWPSRWGADAGIDLVAETHEGALWAVQAKHYDAAYSVTKRDVDSFLSESGRPVFAYRLLIATTDRIARNARSALEGQEKRPGLRLRSDLAAAELSWPSSPDRLLPATPRPKRLRPHQRVAVRDVVSGFKTSERGQLVMACGTGKTLVGLHTAEKVKSRRTLVLLPSLSLLEQTLREWTANTRRPFSYLAVCSDQSVADHDSTVASTTELGVPVTTDPERIAAFLRRHHEHAVVFATYHSSDRIAQAQRGRAPRFDLVIADEAHRCAGPEAGVFATVLDAAKIKAQRRLFMTATPRYFTGRVKKAAQEASYEVASMDDKERFGPVFHSLGFARAIEQDLLTNYQVVVVGVSDRTYRDYAQRGVFVSADGKTVTDARTLASQLGLLRAIAKHDLHRVVSFHSRIANARSFATTLPKVAAWMPTRRRPTGTLWTEHVSGEMSSGYRRVRINRLRDTGNGERGVLTNARCLTEGVDVPTLDGVAFIDPRRSQVDIVQAVGRAIRRSENKTVGTIVIPVFVDKTDDVEMVLDTSEFDRVWNIVRALRDHDDHLAESLDALRRELGRSGALGRLPRKIALDLPIGVSVRFAQAFDTRLVLRTTSTWEQAIGAARAYREAHGHLRVPYDFTTNQGLRLGNWTSVQRAERTARRLSPSQEAALEALGMVWNPYEEDWQRGLAAAQEYRDSNGHLLPPRAYVTADGFPLGAWVSRLRGERRTGRLDSERVAVLEDLDMVWDVLAENWREAIRAARAYRRQHGHLRAPQRFRTEDGFGLGTWLSSQRVLRAQGGLSQQRVAELDALDMVWDVHAANWRAGVESATQFRTAYGHLRVPPGYVDKGGFELGSWITVRRSHRRAGTISQDRISELDVLGMVWSPHESKWERGLGECRRYREAYGDMLVPLEFVTDDGYRLGEWINARRVERRRGTLTSERIEILDRLGMVWNPASAKWRRALGCARAFREANGHLRVPSNFVTEDGVRLGNWLGSRRAEFRRGTLPPERVAELDALGMVWNARE
jgi:superfamily II DNA or RNA helicase